MKMEKKIYFEMSLNCMTFSLWHKNGNDLIPSASSLKPVYLVKFIAKKQQQQQQSSRWITGWVLCVWVFVLVFVAVKLKWHHLSCFAFNRIAFNRQLFYDGLFLHKNQYYEWYGYYRISMCNKSIKIKWMNQVMDETIKSIDYETHMCNMNNGYSWASMEPQSLRHCYRWQCYHTECKTKNNCKRRNKTMEQRSPLKSIFWISTYYPVKWVKTL